MADAKKVELFPTTNWKAIFHNDNIGPRSVSCRTGKPFFATRRMSRVHRTRAATIHYRWVDREKGQYASSHITFTSWCGCTASDTKGGMMMSEPPDSWPICAIFEGKAVGAGQVKSEVLTSRRLLFTPRKIGNKND